MVWVIWAISLSNIRYKINIEELKCIFRNLIHNINVEKVIIIDFDEVDRDKHKIYFWKEPKVSDILPNVSCLSYKPDRILFRDSELKKMILHIQKQLKNDYSIILNRNKGIIVNSVISSKYRIKNWEINWNLNKLRKDKVYRECEYAYWDWNPTELFVERWWIKDINDKLSKKKYYFSKISNVKIRSPLKIYQLNELFELSEEYKHIDFTFGIEYEEKLGIWDSYIYTLDDTLEIVYKGEIREIKFSKGFSKSKIYYSEIIEVNHEYLVCLKIETCSNKYWITYQKPKQDMIRNTIINEINKLVQENNSLYLIVDKRRLWVEVDSEELRKNIRFFTNWKRFRVHMFWLSEIEDEIELFYNLPRDFRFELDLSDKTEYLFSETFIELLSEFKDLKILYRKKVIEIIEKEDSLNRNIEDLKFRIHHQINKFQILSYNQLMNDIGKF